VSAPDFSGAVWRKSTRSNSNGGACVELARTSVAAGLRDSKNSAGPTLAVPLSSLDAFVSAVKKGRFAS
jgi:hypothetical protein